MKKISLVLSLFLSSVLISSCVQEVKPWQKGNLAKEHMLTEPDALHRAWREQIVTSKESASGGYGVVGGGCGCN